MSEQEESDKSKVDEDVEAKKATAARKTAKKTDADVKTERAVGLHR